MDSAPPQRLYLFGWPSRYGGADTKVAHLLKLLHRDFKITVVPNWRKQLDETGWVESLRRLEISVATLSSLPRRLEGVGLGICNDKFFSLGICKQAKERGLRIVWSSEMMWSHLGEREAIEAGLVDRLLYVSPVQQRQLNYESFTSVPTMMTGNFVDADEYPFKERCGQNLTIGRLSRADVRKYSEDFPVFYEALELPSVRFRVMAWSDELHAKYRWHSFDDTWDLLKPLEEDTVTFLHSLDIFVYRLGHSFTETWGRSTVEAMLTGCVPLVPAGHHFEHIVAHGYSGYLCDGFSEYARYAHELSRDCERRRAMARRCREHAVQNLCDANAHRAAWRAALDV